MNRTLVVVCGSIALLLLVTSVEAQAPSLDFDTTDSVVWEKLTPWGKLGYVMGYGHAEQMYRVVLSGTSPACSESAKRSLDGFLKSNPSPTASNAQWVAGLDDFYKDWRNKRVPIAFARRVVALELAGRPKHEVDEAARAVREAASE